MNVHVYVQYMHVHVVYTVVHVHTLMAAEFPPRAAL